MVNPANPIKPHDTFSLVHVPFTEFQCICESFLLKLLLFRQCLLLRYNAPKHTFEETPLTDEHVSNHHHH